MSDVLVTRYDWSTCCKVTHLTIKDDRELLHEITTDAAFCTKVRSPHHLIKQTGLTISFYHSAQWTCMDASECLQWVTAGEWYADLPEWCASSESWCLRACATPASPSCPWWAPSLLQQALVSYIQHAHIAKSPHQVHIVMHDGICVVKCI